MTRVAINGFGRIGRSVFRVVAERAESDIEIVAINDLADETQTAHLLKYDTVMGRFPGDVTVEKGYLVAGGQKAKILTVRDPAEAPWKELKVDVVIESTGVFRTRELVAKHLEAGAKRVILTVPAKDKIDAMVVLGVNDDDLGKDDEIVSNASCTTNCLAPIAKILHDAFGIKRGLMTTVHAYTNDQIILDAPHKDLRRARAAAVNSIPTSTGAAKAVGVVLPELDGKLDGVALRIPVVDGSLVDLVVELEKEVTAAEVNAAVKAAADGPLAEYVEYTEDPIVSSDVLGNPHSAVFDADFTKVLGGDKGSFVKVFAWYDNEWGYSNRVVDLIDRLAAHLS
jgi:glyceraldehyde 3-phosphate dehydrogenase